MESAETFEKLWQRGVAFEHPLETVIEVTGPDARTWLQGMLTADVLDGDRRAIRALSLDRLGKIIAELLVFHDSQGSRLAVVGGSGAALVEHFRRYLIMEDVELRLVDSQLLSLHGASAAELPSRLTKEDVCIAQVTWLAGGDCVCLVPRGDVEHWRQQCEQLGYTFRPRALWDVLRIERGLPAYGTDYDVKDTPGTAGLVDEFVSQSKGCYLGQEVVCKMLMRGAIREQVVRLRFDSAPAAGGTICLTSQDEPIGRVTSVSADPARGAWAIGRVRTFAVEARAEVVSGSNSGRICPRLLEG